MNLLSDNEEQNAQHIACGHLVRGCEAAVSELGLATAEAHGRSPTIERAQDILAQVLSSWRETLEVLRPAETPGAATNDDNLDGWTSAALFSEVVERRAGDAGELRLMQDTIVRALLVAHDGAINGSAQSKLNLN